MMKKISSVIFFVLLLCNLYAQQTDQNELNYDQIYGFALNQNVQAILNKLDSATVLNEKDKQFKTKFENRFKYEYDKSDYHLKEDTTLNPLNRLYQEYWRKSLLDHSVSHDKELIAKLVTFFKFQNSKHQFTNLKISKKTSEKVYNEYIQAKGFHTTGLNKVGSFFDFLVWKNQIDTTYKINLINKTMPVNVILMNGFVSLGWEEYVTFGRYYPGGWATDKALFCVKKAYDLNSEDFIVSYLHHEGQHFSDYKHYPKLIQRDLEYRAKLTELYFADQSIFLLIKNFLSVAKYDLSNPHSFADYCIIRDLSQILFNVDFQKDLIKWEQLPKSSIHETALQLFLLNTDKLNRAGKHVKCLVN